MINLGGPRDGDDVSSPSSTISSSSSSTDSSQEIVSETDCYQDDDDHGTPEEYPTIDISTSPSPISKSTPELYESSP